MGIQAKGSSDRPQHVKGWRSFDQRSSAPPWLHSAKLGRTVYVYGDAKDWCNNIAANDPLMRGIAWDRFRRLLAATQICAPPRRASVLRALPAMSGARWVTHETEIFLFVFLFAVGVLRIDFCFVFDFRDISAIKLC